jgi:phosphoribosylaminoimidazole-succinocarboxamide synthase
MWSDTAPEMLADIDLPLPNRQVGKVRIGYDVPPDRRLFVTTDRLSAFDRLVAVIPHKGQVLNQLAAWWFEHTADIVANHMLHVPDENVSVVIAARPLPVEVIVRRYITGVTSTSLWTRYARGDRTIDGHRLRDGLRKNDVLSHPIITPTTKAAAGSHDEPLAVDEVTSRGLVDAALWHQVQDAALKVFERGSQIADAAGLILADTKYEFGVASDGRLLLIDEIHTPDSSRFWMADSYGERHASGDEPESLDKEVIRRALVDAGYSGDGEPPELDDAARAETSRRYIAAYERITGASFVPGETPIAARIARNVAAYLEGERPR